MLDARVLGHMACAGGEKGERCLRVALVLRQVKTDPTHEVPTGVLAAQPGIDVAAARGNVLTHGLMQILPPRREHCSIEVFRPGHRRHCGRQFLQFCAWGREYERGPLLGQGCDGREARHEQMGKLASEGQSGGQGTAQFQRAQLQQAVRTAAREGLGDARCYGRGVGPSGGTPQEDPAGGRDGKVLTRIDKISP
ncbi:hypothetical protein [Verminephrobacter aporrectodeae]|uniref:hypothetical protein n=1 Tax=Verminephrobacter aporrectodeae TaxID=1110389 RepID=UPI0002376FB6|nr:hypothetical protein [Verminephrobacter aporrectodeae]